MSTLGERIVQAEPERLGRWLETAETLPGRMARVDYLLARMLELEDEVARLAEEEGARIELVVRHYDSLRAGYIHARKKIEQVLLSIAAEYDYPGKSKSIDLPHGKIGRRRKPERVQVDDKDSAASWARAYLPDAIGLIERVDYARVRKHLLASVRESGELPPEDSGCSYVDATDEAYVRPRRSEADVATQTPEAEHDDG